MGSTFDYMREYRKNNRERIRETTRKWRAANRDKVKAHQEKYYANNKAKVRAGIKEWEKKHPDKMLASTHKYRGSTKYRETREKSKEARKATRKRWEKKTGYMKKWYDDHAEEICARAREYAKREHVKVRHREQGKARYKRYREFYLEYEAVKYRSRRSALFLKWYLCQGLCYICGEFVAIERVWIDHVVARANGGTNDISNLMPSHSRCNQKKQDKIDYPIKRPDLVGLVSGITAHPRVPSKKRRRNV